MTRFAELMRKANNCTKTALGLPEGFMRDVWGQKARQLEDMAHKLTIEEASKEVENEYQ